MEGSQTMKAELIVTVVKIERKETLNNNRNPRPRERHCSVPVYALLAMTANSLEFRLYAFPATSE
jgi:hypothetical protein